MFNKFDPFREMLGLWHSVPESASVSSTSRSTALPALSIHDQSGSAITMNRSFSSWIEFLVYFDVEDS